MPQNQLLVTKIKEITPLLSQVAENCIELMFGVQVQESAPWEFVERLGGTFDHLITMGSANEKYSAMIMAGISTTSLRQLLDEDEFDNEYLFDVLGEFLNSYCALLDDTDEFTECFGKQIQAVPLLYSDGAPFMSFLRGIQGKIKIGNEYIYMGYVIRESIDASVRRGEPHGK